MIQILVKHSIYSRIFSQKILVADKPFIKSEYLTTWHTDYVNVSPIFFHSNLFSFFRTSRLKHTPLRIRRPAMAFTMNNCLYHFMGKMLCKGFF